MPRFQVTKKFKVPFFLAVIDKTKSSNLGRKCNNGKVVVVNWNYEVTKEDEDALWSVEEAEPWLLDLVGGERWPPLPPQVSGTKKNKCKYK